MPALVRRAVLALTASLLLVPAVAHASWQSVVTDCTKDGRIDQHHSLQDYTQALAHLPSDVIEYTDCQSIIRRAQLAAAGGGAKHSSGGGGGGGGSASTRSAGSGGSSTSSGGGSSPSTPVSQDPLATATPKQRVAVTHAIRSGGQPVKVGGEVVKPATLGASNVGSPTSLPAALIVLLAALGIGALGIGVAAVLPRVRARRAR